MPNPLTLSVLAGGICDGFTNGNEQLCDMLPHQQEWFFEAARALLTTIEKAGYKIVPVEATEEMLRNGAASQNDFTSKQGNYPRTQAVWSAMLSATPKIGED